MFFSEAQFSDIKKKWKLAEEDNDQKNQYLPSFKYSLLM